MNPFRHVSRNLIFATLLACALPGSSLAQQVYGSIVGTVTDASGGGVVNAKVTVTDQDKNTRSEVATNESGITRKAS